LEIRITVSGSIDSLYNLHFYAEGYRKFGKIFASMMLSIPGYNITISGNKM
jgi:hypothetical protein